MPVNTAYEDNTDHKGTWIRRAEDAIPPPEPAEHSTAHVPAVEDLDRHGQLSVAVQSLVS